MHKSGGSLTQSSLLLCGPGVNVGYVSNIINLTQTTSASYLLMSSLDISRRNLAMRGRESFAKVVDMAEYARHEINAIGDYYAFGSELINGGSIYDFDVTKLAVNTRGIGLTGIEVYDLLRDEYDIQIEFGDLSNILAYISIGGPHPGHRAAGGRAGRYSGASTPSPKATCLRQNISRPRSRPRPSRRSIRLRRACPCARPQGGSAPSSSCAIRRGSPFSHLAK